MAQDETENESRSSQCAVCQIAADKKCTGCNEIVYCGKEHQKKHWSIHKKDCKCWKVIEDPNGIKGRCVIATRNIKCGELVMSDPEKPTLIGPHNVNPSPVCLGCFFPINFIRLRCNNCQIPICEEKCAQSSTHLIECDTLARANQIDTSDDTKHFEDYNIITPLRFLLMKQKQPKNYEKLSSLVSNIESKKVFKNDWEKICNTAKIIYEKYLSKEECTYTIEEIQTAICIIDSNTYHVLVRSGPTMQDFVCGVYTRAAMINHNCRPNTRPIFHGKQERAMNVVAIEDISAGKEISTSYLEPFYTTLQRRALLKRGKLFGCSCQRCSDPTELNSYASAVRCSSCNQGWLLPTEPLNLQSSWHCEKCQAVLSIDQAIAMDNKLIEELQRVNRKSLDNLEKFHRVYDKLLHPSHAFLMQLKQWLFEGYGRTSDSTTNTSETTDSPTSVKSLNRKIALGEQLINFFDKVEGKGSFIRGVIYLEMCDALIKLALQLMSGISDTDATAMKYATASLSNMMPVPVICEKAQNYLASANTLLQHEDPDGPEAGGLIEGARQLERQLTQFH